MSDRAPSVLLVTRTFSPDPAAVGQLVAELAAELSGRGWRVGVATTTPAGSTTEDPAGVEVRRVAPRFAFTRASVPRRALSYFGIFPALRRAAQALPGEWDFIVTTSDPPLQVLLGPLLRRGRASRVVQWSQDLYPELAEALGVLRPRGIVATALRALSNVGLGRSDAIVVPGRCMAERLRARGIPGGKIRVVPNWSPPQIASADSAAGNEFRAEHGIPGSSFVAMYSGNFGLAHSFDSVLAAAKKLRETHPGILFVLVGDGPRHAEVGAEVARHALDNVRLLPLQPREKLPQSLRAADVHLITMRESVAGLAVPSKFYGVLAAGRPCLFVGPASSEVARSIQEIDCGVCVGEFDAGGLVSALVRYAGDPALGMQAGERAAAQARRFTVAASADRLLEAWQQASPGGGEGV